MHHRLARSHGDLPERHLDALGVQRLLDEIVVADRGAAGGNQNIGAAVARAANTLCGGLERVAGDAEIDGVGAFLTGQRAERIAVRIHDLTGTGDRARHHQFVAGGE